MGRIAELEEVQKARDGRDRESVRRQREARIARQKAVCIAGLLLFFGRLAQSQPRELIPQDFGAKADGRADDTAAMQRTITEAVKTGSSVFLPAGVYLCDSPTGNVILNILANVNDQIVLRLGESPTTGGGRTHGGITIRGAGQRRTIIKTTKPESDLMAAVASEKVVYYPQYVLEDFTLQGPDIKLNGDPLCPFTKTNGVSGNGLRISGTNASKVSIIRVNAEGFCGPGKAAIWLENAEEFTIDDISARYSDIGLKLTKDTNASTGNMVKLDSNLSYGGYFESSSALTFNTMLVQSNCGTGLFLRFVGGLTANSMYIENNNNCGRPGSHGIYAERLTDSAFSVPTIITARDDIYLDGANVVSSRNYFVMGPPPAFQAGAKATLAGTHAAGNTWVNMAPEWFADPDAAIQTETFINPVPPFQSGPSSLSSPALQANRVTYRPQKFTNAIAADCGNGSIPEGSTEMFENASMSTPGSVVTAGGSFRVLAMCAGKQWIVGSSFGQTAGGKD